jgi:hypothetical protein
LSSHDDGDVARVDVGPGTKNWLGNGSGNRSGTTERREASTAE